MIVCEILSWRRASSTSGDRLHSVIYEKGSIRRLEILLNSRKMCNVEQECSGGEGQCNNA